MDKIYRDTGSAQAGGPSRPWPTQYLYLTLFLPYIKGHGVAQTQALHLVFERRTDRLRTSNINVQGPGRLIAGRSGDGCYEPQHLVSHYVSSIMLLQKRTYTRGVGISSMRKSIYSGTPL